MKIDATGLDSQALWRLKSGRDMPGRLTALVRYEIPVCDPRWNGSFVRGDVGGRAVVGAMNDWTAETDIYAAARARVAGPRPA